MGIISEFKAFAIKGNAIDLAVGVIIGGAFGKIVSSLVNDIIMPVMGSLVGDLDFSQLFLALKAVPEGVPMVLADVQKAGIPVLAYGNFMSTAIHFLIMAFAIFLMVRQINRLKRQEPVAPSAPPVTPEDILLLREIRDQLKR